MEDNKKKLVITERDMEEGREIYDIYVSMNPEDKAISKAVLHALKARSDLEKAAV